ncbi:hypothetical protein P4S91_24045 [Aneurinibacillus aneurinilyticus]|uniref:hypothetical protein n=1 Tax=Aneurinibacillus aneurinilyticus TaxID=1391 RepID=UPI002E1ED0C1|nr:hypothetical protein [Aneurinibacillus aneurinilyticus]
MSLWVVERSFWPFYHFYLEKGAVPHLLSIHKVEERGCTRRRVPSSFSHKEETQPLCGARAGPAKHLGITGRETVAGRFRPWRHTLHTVKKT